MKRLRVYFYSHTPCGVQPKTFANRKIYLISTHTPLAGCNIFIMKQHMKMVYFYSHTPCGVQQFPATAFTRKFEFLLTHPLRGATKAGVFMTFKQNISTHTPLAGCNNSRPQHLLENLNFYSHTPCGVQQRQVFL